MNLLDWLGGRRFLLALLCHATVVWLKAHDKLGDATFGTVVLGTTAAYISANAHQRYLEARAAP